jgi:uncharacterized cupredoxin-like copper-binding protein
MQKASNKQQKRYNKVTNQNQNTNVTGKSRFKTFAATSLTIVALLGFVVGVWNWEAVNAANTGIDSYTVTITDTCFQPNILKGSVGSTVKIHLINKGKKEHNFVLPAFYIFSPNLHAGESTDIEFSPDKAGTFPYDSDAPGFQEPGLSGHLIVR